MKPCTAIEYVPASVVVKDNGFIGRLCEEIVLQFLSEEYRSGKTDGVVLLPAPDIEEKKFLVDLDSLLQAHGADEQGLIPLVAGEKGLDSFLYRNVVAGADFSEGLVIPVGARLASSDMIGSEQCPPRARKERKEILHPLGSAYFYFPGHGISMAKSGTISSVCVERNLRIMAARWRMTGSRGFTSCPT